MPNAFTLMALLEKLVSMKFGQKNEMILAINTLEHKWTEYPRNAIISAIDDEIQI